MGSDRRLRRQPARIDVLHVRDDAEVAACADDGPPVLLHPVHHPLPGRSRPLLDDDEPLDGGAGTDHPPVDPQGRPAGSSEALVANGAERDRRGRNPADRGADPAEGSRGPAASREAEEEGKTLMELQVEATGETVGEAKWAALRELEKQQPGVDKSAVRFQVVTEG